MRIKLSESKISGLLAGLDDNDWIAAAEDLDDVDFEALVALARLADKQSNANHADALLEWRKPKPKRYVASFHFEATEQLGKDVFEKMQEGLSNLYPRLNLRAREKKGEFVRGTEELMEE